MCVIPSTTLLMPLTLPVYFPCTPSIAHSLGFSFIHVCPFHPIPLSVFSTVPSPHHTSSCYCLSSTPYTYSALSVHLLHSILQTLLVSIFIMSLPSLCSPSLLFMRSFASLCSDFPGEDLAERGAQETSSVVVETVQKVAKSRQVGPVLPLFKSDASKVTSKGMGLKKAYLQKQNMFTVHAGDAGRVTATYYMYHRHVL